MERPSQIKINVSLSQTVTLIQYEPYLLPEYIFEFPVGDKNERTGIERSCECAPESFSQLELQFQSSSNVSPADIFQFLSDITGEDILVSNFVINILSNTANATLCLNFNNNFRFQSIHLLFGIGVAKPFPKMPCKNQT